MRESRSISVCKLGLLIAAQMFLLIDPFSMSQSRTTNPTTSQREGGRLRFEVASVRASNPETEPKMNVDSTLGNNPIPGGGLYIASNIKLIQFIAFAYKLTQIQLESVVKQVPWTAEEHFDIEARAEGSPTKDEYRQMMQSLLADRFSIAVHYEERMLPVYKLVLARPGKFGPQLRLHRAGDPVCVSAKQNEADKKVGYETVKIDEQGFPEICGNPLSLVPSNAGRMKSGGRDVSMQRFAAVETGVGAVNQPMVDHTGIEGNVDYVIEWEKVPENVGPAAQFEHDDSALTFEGALRAQLGIKMVSDKELVRVFRVDHIERPTPN